MELAAFPSPGFKIGDTVSMNVRRPEWEIWKDRLRQLRWRVHEYEVREFSITATAESASVNMSDSGD